jgi:hypothetical protein
MLLLYICYFIFMLQTLSHPHGLVFVWMGGKKSMRIEKTCIFHHIWFGWEDEEVAGRIKKVCIFLYLIVKKNKRMEKVIYMNEVLCL